MGFCGWLLVVLPSGLACNDGGGGGSVPSGDADLADLSIFAGVLTPAFDANTTSYAVTATALTSSTMVTATSSNANATIEIDGQAATSGAALPVPLVEGTNAIDVVVTAQDLTTTKTYTIVLTGPGFTTSLAASSTAALQVSGPWLVYLADEMSNGVASTDLNGDGDTIDEVAVSVNLTSNVERVLGPAAEGATILDDEIYLVVEEVEDGRDWSGANALADRVLLHWSEASGVVSFVDVLHPSTGGPDVLANTDRLYYAAGALLGLVDETSIRFVDASAPTTPMTVLNEAGGGTLDAELLAMREFLLFLELDETSGVGDLNGDTDAIDEHVLGLLDSIDPAARVKNVGLALADDSAPVAAARTGPFDWLAAFLVDEAAQGATNLNDQALFAQPLLPGSCAGTPDMDAADEVLHYLEFANFLGGAPPVNSGVAGRERVLAVPGIAATISPESDANCDLNADGDASDRVARWLITVVPVAPAREDAQMHALATSIPGGSRGLSILDARLIAVVSEADDAQDLDGKVPDHDLVAWLDPDLGQAATWHFQHQHPTVATFGTFVFDTDGDSEPFAGTSWMAAAPVGDRLGMTFLEEVPGTNPDVGPLNTNLDCSLVPKDSDKTDALPVWPDFESGSTLDFDGLGYAIDPTTGVVIASGFAFFRVSETDDNRDYNADGDTSDLVLFRNPLTVCAPAAMATSSSTGGDVITTDGVLGAAFLSSEAQAGIDFNSDGDATDLVVRYFRF